MIDTDASKSGIEVFFSYSHHDEPLRDELGKQLTSLMREGTIDGWHDRRITPGEDWSGEIDAHLESASLILLLISKDFVASDYCYDIEMETAMKRGETGDSCVIPVVLKPVDWSSLPFAMLQSLPKDGRPITEWGNRDEALLDVTQGICAAISALGSSGHPVRATDVDDELNLDSVRRLGRFELLGRVRPQHFPTVYRAIHGDTNQEVAVRVMRKGQRSAKAARKDLRTNASLTGHPHIIRVYQFRVEGEFLYMVMEPIDDRSLEDRLQDDQFSPREAAELCASVARTLGYVHSKGIVHCNIKPQNILFDRENEHRLIDFAISMEIGEQQDPERIVGTLAYMSPEALSGEVSPQTDIYSLGVVLYRMLAHRLPFEADSMADLVDALTQLDPVDPRSIVKEVPGELAAICLKCLAKDPQDRYGNADELANDLDLFLDASQ